MQQQRKAGSCGGDRAAVRKMKPGLNRNVNVALRVLLFLFVSLLGLVSDVSAQWTNIQTHVMEGKKEILG